MDNMEQNTGSVKSAAMQKATCWECGKELQCFEYIVCCTGTLFHICPECEAKTQEPAQPNPAGR